MQLEPSGSDIPWIKKSWEKYLFILKQETEKRDQISCKSQIVLFLFAKKLKKKEKNVSAFKFLDKEPMFICIPQIRKTFFPVFGNL